MDTNNPILIAAPRWLDTALEEHDGEPVDTAEDEQSSTESNGFPLGFL
jgi:hypothetical protein